MSLPESPSPLEVLLTHTNEAANSAYSRIAEETGVPVGDVHRQPIPDVCRVASRLIVDSLTAKGHRACRVARIAWLDREYDENGRGVVPVMDENHPSCCVHHSYCMVETEGSSTRRIIDPTWQQFLPPEGGSHDLPKVLFSPVTEVTSRLREYGIKNEELLGLWTPRNEQCWRAPRQHRVDDL